MNNQDTRNNNQTITNNQIQITKQNLFDHCLPAGKAGILNIGICLYLVSCFLVIGHLEL
jgi:hypothetical protein